MNSSSFVDITANRRRHQLSLHPSSDGVFPYTRYILGVAGQIVLTNHYLVHIRSLPIWFAGSKPEPDLMLFMQFSYDVDLCLSFSSADVPSILNTD